MNNLTGKATCLSHNLIPPFIRAAVLATFLFMLAEGLVAQRPELLYLRLNNVSGSTTLDFALPGFPGISMSLQGGATFDSANPKLGLSCLNTATPIGPLIPLVTSNSPASYSGDWTIEMWLRKDTQPGTGSSNVIFGEYSSTSPLYIARGVANPNSNTITLGGQGLNIVGVKNATSTGNWNHLAFVHDSIALTITSYLNGVPLPPVPQPFAVDIVGDGSNGLVLGGIFGNHWEGAMDEIRIWSRALSNAEILANLNTQINAASVDAAVTQITSPVQESQAYVPLSNSEPVAVRVSNVGTSLIPSGTMMPISHVFDGGAPVTETLVLGADLSIGESVPFVFSSTLDLTGPGTHEIEVFLNFSGDQQPINDSKKRVIGGNSGHYITEFPYLETFDSIFEPGFFPPPSWSQDLTNGFFTWNFENQTIITGGAGTSDDHTASPSGDRYWAYCPSAPNSFPANRLRSPIFDLRANSNPRLDFWVTSNTNNAVQSNNTLSIDVIIQPSGTVVQDVGGPFGDFPMDWGNQGVDLSAFSGQVIQLVLRADMSVNPIGNAIAVDDIRITDHPIGPGQPPQPGLSVMDINTSLSPGGLDLSFNENGPYLSMATPGGPLDFFFEGEASQPIILMFGEYNPMAATFPNIGQMDIGGTPHPVTGIPINTFTLFDGTSTFGLNPLFRTNISGESRLHFLMPQVPPGLLTTFQAATFNSTIGVSLSNAVQLEVQ